MGNFDVSVIIPVYNAELYIHACISSLLRQQNVQLQIIAVNDGSTDRSLHILTQLACDNAHLIVLSQDNRGVSSARNLGLANARGRYVFFVDADDCIPDPSALGTIVAQADGVNAQIVLSDIYQVNEHMCLDSGSNYCSSLLDLGIHMSLAWAPLVSRSVLKLHRISFDEHFEYGEDPAFFYEVLLLCDRILTSHDVYYTYRDNAQSATKKRTLNRYHETFSYLSLYVKYANDPSTNGVLDPLLYVKIPVSVAYCFFICAYAGIDFRTNMNHVTQQRLGVFSNLGDDRRIAHTLYAKYWLLWRVSPLLLHVFARLLFVYSQCKRDLLNLGIIRTKK